MKVAASQPVWRWPLSWLCALTLAVDAALVGCCLRSFLRSIETYYLALVLLAALAGLLAAGLLLVSLLRRQWHRALPWVVLSVFNFGSCWAGLALFLYTVGVPFTPDPPPGSPIY
jgi:hypothetical protein